MDKLFTGVFVLFLAAFGVLGLTFIGFLIQLLWAWPLTWAWNFVMPGLFGLAKLTFWKSYAILVVAMLLVKGGSSSSSSSK